MTFLEVLVQHSASTPRHQDDTASISIAEIGPLTEWMDTPNGIAQCFDPEVPIRYHQITSAEEGAPLQETSHTIGAADQLGPRQNIPPQTMDGLNTRIGLDSDGSMLLSDMASAICGTSQSSSLHVPQSTITYYDGPLAPWGNANPNSVLSNYESQHVTDQDVKVASTTPNHCLYTLSEKACLPGPTTSHLTPAGQVSPLPTQIIKKLGKRRRLPSFLSRKRQRIASPQPADRHERKSVNALGTPRFPSNSPSLPETAIAHVPSSIPPGSQIDDHLASRIVKTDWIANWEGTGGAGSGLENAGIVRDVNVADCDRRPMSWPLRHHFRKSIDISVAVLTKKFEQKLHIEN